MRTASTSEGAERGWDTSLQRHEAVGALRTDAGSKPREPRRGEQFLRQTRFWKRSKWRGNVPAVSVCLGPDSDKPQGGGKTTDQRASCSVCGGFQKTSGEVTAGWLRVDLGAEPRDPPRGSLLPTQEELKLFMKKENHVENWGAPLLCSQAPRAPGEGLSQKGLLQAPCGTCPRAFAPALPALPTCLPHIYIKVSRMSPSPRGSLTPTRESVPRSTPCVPALPHLSP